MRILKYALAAVAALLGGAFAYGLTLPNTMHGETGAVIDAPASVIYAQADNYKSFNKWSPWREYDPNAQYTVTGPAHGVGAKQSWSGNSKVGTGSQEIVEAKPYSLIRTKLVFGGFEQNVYSATMTFTPQGAGTRVDWSFDGKFGGSVFSQVMSRYFALLMGDAVMQDYARGLANLKKLAESLPKDDFGTLQVELVSAKPIAIAMSSGHSSTEDGEVGKALGEAYARIVGFMKANNLGEAGPPLAITRKWDETAKVFEFDAGIPVDRADVAASPGEVRMGATAGGKLLKVRHTGPYRELPKTYDMLDAYMAAYGYEKAGDEWEQYVSDPGKTPEAELITDIYYPVK